MKGLIWTIILFAVAVGVAIAAKTFNGNVYIVVEQTMLRVNLHFFAIGLLLLVGVLYLILALLAGVLRVPTKLQRFGLNRKGKKAGHHLQAAGLAYFEGKFQQAEQEAAKVLANKEAGDNRVLALMLAAHAADQMDNIELRNQYLQDIARLPEKAQLSRYLLLADSALANRDYALAQENITAAAKLNPNLTRLVKLQLRYAFDHGDAVEALDKVAKLQKAGALNAHESEQYRIWAYRHLLAMVSHAEGLKACLKRIPDDIKTGELCVAIAEKYQDLGLYAGAVAWVQKHYPQTKQAELLPVLVQSVPFLSEKEQQQAIDIADNWLRQQADDAELLTYLGQLAYSKQLWGKAQGYLEASLAVRESAQARLVLAKVFDATEQADKAEAQRKQVLEEAVHNEHPALLSLDKPAE